MNRQQTETKLSRVTSELLREKGFIAPVDVLLRMGWLDPEDHKAWRQGRVPFLDKVVKANLSKITFLMKTLRRNSLNGGLRPSWTDYRSWEAKDVLRFSKSGDRHVESNYATHFVAHPPSRDREGSA